jgi:hypothetical protein
MDQKLQTIMVHAGCIMVICLCFGLAELTELRTVLLFGMPVMSRALEVSGFWLWGKLGFKPAEAIIAKIIASMEPAEVIKALSMRPPAQALIMTGNLSPEAIASLDKESRVVITKVDP